MTSTPQNVYLLRYSVYAAMCKSNRMYTHHEKSEYESILAWRRNRGARRVYLRVFGRYTFRSSAYTSRARAYTPESGGGTRVYLRLTKVYHFRKKRILFCMKGILLKQNVYSSLFLPNGAGLGLRGFGVQGGRSGVGAGTLVGPGP